MLHHPKNKKGQGLTEYVLLIALMGLVLIATLGAVSDSLNNYIFQTNEKIESASAVVESAN